jgi:hypothetical protein
MPYSVLLSDIDPYYSECLESQWDSIAEAVDEELAAMRAGFSTFEQFLIQQEVNKKCDLYESNCPWM